MAFYFLGRYLQSMKSQIQYRWAMILGFWDWRRILDFYVLAVGNAGRYDLDGGGHGSDRTIRLERLSAITTSHLPLKLGGRFSIMAMTASLQSSVWPRAVPTRASNCSCASKPGSMA